MVAAGAAADALEAPDPVAAAVPEAAEEQDPAAAAAWPLELFVVELLNKAHRARENSQWVRQRLERAADSSGTISLQDAVHIAQSPYRNTERSIVHSLQYASARVGPTMAADILDYTEQYRDHLRAERLQDPPSSSDSDTEDRVSSPI